MYGSLYPPWKLLDLLFSSELRKKKKAEYKLVSQSLQSAHAYGKSHMQSYCAHTQSYTDTQTDQYVHKATYTVIPKTMNNPI